MASAALLLVRLYVRRTGANARFDRTSYRWTSRHAAARGGHALLIDGGYPRSRRHPHSRRGHEPTCRRRTPAAHCRRPRRRPHRRRPPTRHFCAARASASPPPSHLPPARHRFPSTEMPPLSPSHASPPSHRRRYRCCPDPGAGARVPTLTTTTTVAPPSAPPPPSRRPVPTPCPPRTPLKSRRTGLQIVYCAHSLTRQVCINLVLETCATGCRDRQFTTDGTWRRKKSTRVARITTKHE